VPFYIPSAVYAGRDQGGLASSAKFFTPLEKYV